MLKETVHFAACYKSVVGMDISGHKEDDNICLATVMLNCMMVVHAREGIGKPFRFLKCCELLRDKPRLKAAEHGSSS